MACLPCSALLTGFAKNWPRSKHKGKKFDNNVPPKFSRYVIANRREGERCLPNYAKPIECWAIIFILQLSELAGGVEFWITGSFINQQYEITVCGLWEFSVSAC